MLRKSHDNPESLSIAERNELQLLTVREIKQLLRKKRIQYSDQLTKEELIQVVIDHGAVG